MLFIILAKFYENTSVRNFILKFSFKEIRDNYKY